MVKLLRTRQHNFTAELDRVLDTKSEYDPEINQTVMDIIQHVRAKGDEALLDYTAKFDNARFSADDLRVDQDEIQEAYRSCPLSLTDALHFAAKRIEDYHYKQTPENLFYHEQDGIRLGWKWTPIDTVGLYVPGGKAVYPSSVLMNAIPANIAGVARMVMVVPAPGGKVNPAVLAAANIAGIEEIYKIGGAQAIAALTYGTETVPKVDKIVGPGNAYVAAAKRQVFGHVGIDMIAGPSEILVIADHHNAPEWMAADLLSQAEHDAAARSIFITDNEDYAKDVIQAVNTTIPKLNRATIARQSWDKNGLVIITKDLYEAAEVANIIAAEHVELAVNEPHKLEKRIQNAGAIFMGRFTPEAVGDYTAGPSHVLPTAGSGRFSSGLGVFDFLKRTSLIHLDKQGMQQIARHTIELANHEGLGAHALSVSLRHHDKA